MADLTPELERFATFRALQEAYGPIWGIPASFLISKDGKVCRKHLGIAPKTVFEKEIAALM